MSHNQRHAPGFDAVLDPSSPVDTARSAAPDGVHQPPWRWALGITLGVTLVRLFVLRASPLQLYPDEAQYWVWSRSLDFGYLSKPPLVAWIIWLTTHVFGDGEPFVRVSSPLLHAAAGLFIYGAARKLYDAWTGVLSLALYQLTIAVQLGAFVVSTDTPLCAFLAAALWLYAELQTAEGRARTLIAGGFGLSIGLAFLAKYAALYAVIGVGLHLALSRDARRIWTWPAAALAILGFAATGGLNLAWNAAHGFATLAYTSQQAAWDARRHFDLAQLGGFIGAQFGVFGPAPFAVLIGGGAALAWRRRLLSSDGLLVAWTAPPLLIVAGEAFISRANANWAVAAYVPGSVLVAAWLIRWRARGLTAVIVGGQALIALALVIGLAVPSVADRVGAANALKLLRGWREATAVIVQRAELESMAGPLSAIAVDDRYLFNEAAYYGRAYFGQAGAPPLRIWRLAAAPGNEAELTAPLTAAAGRRVLAASLGGVGDRAMMESFAKSGDLQINTIGLDRRHSRRIDTFVAEDFTPAR